MRSYFLLIVWCTWVYFASLGYATYVRPLEIFYTALSSNRVDFESFEVKSLLQSITQDNTLLGNDLEAKKIIILISKQSTAISSSVQTPSIRLPNAVMEESDDMSLLLGADTFGKCSPNMEGNPMNDYFSSRGSKLAIVCPDNAEQEVAVMKTLTDEDVFVHVGVPPLSPQSSPPNSILKRRMQETQQVCDDACQNGVRLMEGFIIFLTLGMALVLGVTCMNMVDTPSRFLAAQGSHTAQRPHQD